MIVTYKTNDGGENIIVHVGSNPQAHIPNTAWVEVPNDVHVVLGENRWNTELGKVEPINSG